MPLIELFSTRKKLVEKAGTADIYTYDKVPNPLRVQIVHIWRDAMGDMNVYQNEGIDARWRFINNAIAREKGLFGLGNEDTYESACINWFLKTTATDDALDIIELTFRFLERIVDDVSDYDRQTQKIKIRSAEAIEELNARFKQHGIGYRYENGQLVRIDSGYVHAEVTKPALALIQNSEFSAANEEFLGAHRHYRNGEIKDCVVACQRAFESTLKTICALKKWNFDKGDRLPELLKIVRLKGLFPDYLDHGFDTYIAMLKTGLPGVRNQAGGHGQGPKSLPVPDYIAAYALHMTATNIVLAIDAYNAL